MNKAKDSVQLLNELQVLLDARDAMIDTREIHQIIADTVKKFLKAFNAEMEAEVKNSLNPSELPKKSEMPCNCRQKTLQEIIDEAKAELTDSKTFAAIVFRLDD